MSFTKLFSSITDSTMWDEPHHVRIVWITMLAMADRNGCIVSSIPGLAHRARVSIAECEQALEVFFAPDPYSRTRDYEGRRIIDLEGGGWFLLNYEKFREVQDSERVKESKRRWAAKRRQQMSTVDAPVESRQTPSASSSLSSSDLDQSLGEQDQIKIPPAQAQAERTVFRNLSGWTPRPELFARAVEIGLPRDVVEERIAELRNGPIGGARGVFDRDDYVLRQLPKWRAWRETAVLAAVHPPGGPYGGPVGVRRGPNSGALLEPTDKHRAYAQAHGLDLAGMFRDLLQTDIVEKLGPKRALEILGERMTAEVRKRKGAQGAA